MTKLNEVVIVIDNGTSSMRCALIGIDGRLVWLDKRGYSPDFISDEIVVQDPRIWLNNCLDLLKAASAYAETEGITLRGLALTSQRSSVIPVDRAGKALTKAMMWQDKRVTPHINTLKTTEEARIIELSGTGIVTTNAGIKINWFKENEPEIYASAYKMITPADYLVFHLTGNFVTDHSYGSRTSLMNIRSREWDPELLGLFKVDAEKLCDIVQPGSIVGYLVSDLIDRASKLYGLPLISAGGDQQCSALGLGVIGEGFYSLTAGTGGYVVTTKNEVPETLDGSFSCGVSAVPGKYNLETTMLTCSAAYDFVIRKLYSGETSPYDIAEKEMAEIPIGSNGTLFLPFFQGRGSPDRNLKVKAQISGITLSTSRGELAQSCLEGIACEFNNHILSLSEMVKPEHQIIVSGGLFKNQKFLQIVTDTMQLPFSIRDKYESTVYGAWLAATRALGIYEDYSEGLRQIETRYPSVQAIPNPDNFQTYSKLRKRFNLEYDLRKQLTELVN